MSLLYLDYHCFQRRFDDARQVRIRCEAAACEAIFSRAKLGTEALIWSFMHDDENELCPFPARRMEIFRGGLSFALHVGPTEKIREQARTLVGAGRLSPKDALHVACALDARADWFLTCDDPLLKRATRLNLGLQLANPRAYVDPESLQP